jgi:hypothetical protein
MNEKIWALLDELRARNPRSQDDAYLLADCERAVGLRDDARTGRARIRVERAIRIRAFKRWVSTAAAVLALVVGLGAVGFVAVRAVGIWRAAKPRLPSKAECLRELDRIDREKLERCMKRGVRANDCLWPDLEPSCEGLPE